MILWFISSCLACIVLPNLKANEKGAILFIAGDVPMNSNHLRAMQMTATLSGWKLFGALLTAE